MNNNVYDKSITISNPDTTRPGTLPEGLNIITDISVNIDNITPPILCRQNTTMYDVSSNFISGLQPPILRRQKRVCYELPKV